MNYHRYNIQKIVVILVLVLSIITCSIALFDTEYVFGATKPMAPAYDYPVRPGSTEWSKFNTRIEKINACQIPERLLESLPTKALVETVMNYPLIIDMVVRDTKLEGFKSLLRVFNGLQELVERPDAFHELENYKTMLYENTATDIETTLKKGYIEYLYIGLINKQANPVNPQYSTSTVYTPMGTPVSTLYNLSWFDHGLTPAQANYYNDELKLAYPNADPLREEYPSYNCHSYAWHSTSSTNKHWINNPNVYMTDGSYTSGIAQAGSKVYYGNIANHSGRVVYVGASMYNVKIYSKWGNLGMYSHNILDCPYAEGSYTCSFWK